MSAPSDPSRPPDGASPVNSAASTALGTEPAPAPGASRSASPSSPPYQRPHSVHTDELRVLPADHLQRNLAVILEADEARVRAVFDPDPNAPTPSQKRRRGRPPGQQMRMLAASLRHVHFSFLRACVEGVRDLKWAGEHYLGFEGGPDDQRHYHMRLRELVKLVTFAASERGLVNRATIAFSGLDLRPPAMTPALGAEVVASGTGAQYSGVRGESGNATLPASTLPSRFDGEPSAPTPTLPTLEEWITLKCEEWGVDTDYHREAEWLEQYEEEFGLGESALPQLATAHADRPEVGAGGASPAGSAAKAGGENPAAGASETSDSGAPVPVGALQERIEHLNLLAFELSKPPALPDTLASWLTPELARRLAGARIKGNPMPLVTLANLIDFVNLFGHRWWVHVPRLGQERAQRLLAWLVPLALELQRPVKEASTVPHAMREAAQRQAHFTALALHGPQALRRYGLVPLEQLAVPAELDGSLGLFRSTLPNVLGKDNDLDAIEAWLERQPRQQTKEHYKRMLERFYLWCVWIKKKPLGDLVEGDFRDYREFLKAPPADWVSSKPTSRQSPDWRPLRGPQNENSLRQNFTVINALLTALHKAGYLTAQAAAGVMPSLKLRQLRVNIDRSFDDDQWAWIMTCLKRRQEEAEEAYAQALAKENEAALKEGRMRRLIFPMRVAILRRQRLVLELGATTGLRLIELVTTRRRQIRREVVDGAGVWLAKVLGKGLKEREVLIYDDLMELMAQHHADMDAAGTSFDATTDRMRTVERPGAELTKAQRDAAIEKAKAAPSPALPGPTTPDDEGMRPMVGALHRAIVRPVAKVSKDQGVDGRAPSSNEELPPSQNSDRYGSLDPNGLRQALKRFLSACADEADLDGAPIDTSRLRAATTHWMRHFFANSAASDGIQGSDLMGMMGHESLATTSVYLRQERTQMVRAISRMKRRGS
jgi:site-specific recombinase XerD